MNFNKPFYHDNGGCWEQPEDDEMSLYGNEESEFTRENTVVVDVPEVLIKGTDNQRLQGFVNLQGVSGEPDLVRIDAIPEGDDTIGIIVNADNLVAAINAITGRRY